MRTRTTLSLVCIAALMGAFVFFYEIKQPGTDQRIASEGMLFENLSLDDLIGVDLERPGERITIRQKDGAFRIDSPIEDAADDQAVEDLLREILAVQAKTFRAPETVSGGDDATGLGASALRAVLHSAQGSSTLEIGTRPIAGNLRFARTGKSEQLALVDRQVAELLATPLSALRDRRVFEFSPFDVGSVSISSQTRLLRLSRRGAEAWWIEDPLVDEAEPAEVHQLLSELAAIRADRFVPPGLVEDPGFDPPNLVIAASGRGEDSASTQVEIGREAADNTGRYYVRREGRQALFEIYLAPLLSDLEQEHEHWRSRRILDFSPWDVVEVALSRSGQQLRITRVEGQTDAAASWAPMEPEQFPLDAGALVALLTELSDVEALRLSAPAPSVAITPVASLELFFRDSETTPPLTLEVGTLAEAEGVWVRRQGRQALLLMDAGLARKIDPAQVRLAPTTP